MMVQQDKFSERNPTLNITCSSSNNMYASDEETYSLVLVQSDTFLNLPTQTKTPNTAFDQDVWAHCACCNTRMFTNKLIMATLYGTIFRVNVPFFT